jgi:glycosyltransferase involved in cell wall biosynthesis
VPDKALYNYQWGHDGAIMTQILNKSIVSNLENPDYYKKEDTNIDVIIYEHVIPEIGGNATSLVNWVKHMSKYYNITVLFNSISQNHRNTLSKYANLVAYVKQPLECDILVYNSSWGKYPDTIKFKGEPKQILHANYREVYKLNGFKYSIPKIPTKHISVSKHVSEVFEDMYNIPSKVIYNMLDPDVKVEKVLRLVTCSRLTKEKGLDNILKFAKMLRQFNKKFIWFIYGAGNIPSNFKDYPEIILMGVSYELPSYIADCDYMVHLSYSEGDPYCTKEALQVNTPCITTSYPATYEQITDEVNGYILDFDLFTKGTNEEWKKIIDKIYKKIPKFQYECNDKEIEKIWIDEVLGKPIGKLKKLPITKNTKIGKDGIEVISLVDIFYIEENKNCKKGDSLIIKTKERLDFLLGNNPSNKKYIEIRK